jgi:hypothetical protein
MSNFEPDGPSENEWEDRGELAWNEFDWEHYLRDQEDVIHRYLAFYEQLRDHPDRIDEVAHLMRWDRDEWSSDGGGEDDDATYSAEADLDEKSEANEYDAEPYTLHKNPIFITTKAIYLSLKRSWERIAGDADKVPQAMALALQTSLYRGEEHALLAIQALDFGDYAMATSLFKRALRELNQSFSLLDERSAGVSRALSHFRADALPRLFDLRETWLRVMNECREELDRSGDDSDGEA